MRRRGRRPALAATAAAAALTLAAALSGCDAGAAPRPSPTTSTNGPVHLTFGVYGPPAEIHAFRRVVRRYDANAVDTRVTLRTWPSHAAMQRDLAAAAEQSQQDQQAGSGTSHPQLPDLFLAGRDDVSTLTAGRLNQPVFSLLDERGVDFGDEFSHTAIEGFSADNDLQCMPYSVSPLMVYYNTDLVDFAALKARGLDVPVPDDPGTADPADTSADSWTFAQFSTVARAVARDHPGVRGVDIRPTLRSLAPFLVSGGGRLFTAGGDAAQPTSLDLENTGSTSAMTTVLSLLRARRAAVPATSTTSPVSLFAQGKVAMIEGFRSLTPQLRRVPGLHFDVMPMPVLGTPATTGELDGICLARGRQVQSSADFLTHLISNRSFAELARTGYVVPADQSVARQTTPDGSQGPFLQPGRAPAHAALFNSSVDDIALLPLIDDWDGLDAAVEAPLTALVTQTAVPDLTTALPAIDELSRPVLDPTYSPSPSSDPSDPSPAESSDPSDPPSG